MRQSFTATIERNTTFTANFETEPYEAGWASEARWFIRILDISGFRTEIRAIAQVSPDGINWCDEGTMTLMVHERTMLSFALRDFGSWLRLRCEVDGEDPRVKIMIHLALKE